MVGKESEMNIKKGISISAGFSLRQCQLYQVRRVCLIPAQTGNP